MKKYKYLFHKIFNWEYWPQWLIYAPISPVYLYYTLKAKTPFFIVAANPTMENGGYLMESKFTIHNQLPYRLLPKTFLVKHKETNSELLYSLWESNITFPFYCKPDIGGKGRGVVKITNEDELLFYHTNSPINYLVQEEIKFKNEIGVFYCRLPNQSNGFITGIVGKKPITLIGDGINTIKQLIEATPRYYFQRKFLFTKYASELEIILPINQEFILSEIGNHARGSMFVDLSHLNNNKLEGLFDTISNEYNTFYFGRYDIKFNTWEELYEGKNFMLIELNGSGSEPTHIYDPKTNLFKAWQIIVQHWSLMYRISSLNKKNGAKYASLKDGLRLVNMERVISKAFQQKKNLLTQP